MIPVLTPGRVHGCCVKIAMDEYGMLPHDLDAKLEWASQCLSGLPEYCGSQGPSPARPSALGSSVHQGCSEEDQAPTHDIPPYKPPSGRPPRLMYQIPTGMAALYGCIVWL